MARTLFPTLRPRGLSSKDGRPQGMEEKVVLSSYYAAIASAGITLPGAQRSKPWPIERAVAEGFERVVWIFAPVNVISSNQARLPFRLREGMDPAADPIDDHPLYRVLNVQANPLETGRAFRKRLGVQALLSRKGTFVEVGKSNAQTVTRVDLLPPGRTRLVPGTGTDLVDHVEVDPVGGGTPRSIDWEKVLWIREPHPLDPYGAMTPLEAAGLSVELDHFARLYNVSFMRNDGRPGGILGIKAPEKGGGDMDEREMDRLESRFSRGPVEAGKLSVISGDLSYVDVAAKPRDLQYGATSKNAKTEMLVAFGVPESQLGNAADRTFANAAEEGYAFWTGTQRNHNDLVTGGFDELSEPNLHGYLDVSDIEVLARAANARRQEAREEVSAGLRSIRSYAVLAGMDDEIEDTPITRALYINSGKTPIPAREADAEALGLAPPEDTGAEVTGEAPSEAPGQAPPAAAAEDAVDEQSAAAANTPGLSPSEAVREALQGGGEGKAHPFAYGTKGHPLSRLRLVGGTAVPVRRTIQVTPREVKAEPDPEGDRRESSLDDRLRDSTETAVEKALAALADKQRGRVIARLKSPGGRKGTRHWEAQYAVDTRVGEKALDAAKIGDEDVWETEATDAVQEILYPAATSAVEALLADLVAGEVKALPTRLLKRITKVVDGAVNMVGESAARQGQIIATLINDLDQAGRDVPAIVKALRALADQQGRWAKGLAVHTVTAALEGARDAVVVLLEDEGGLADVQRSWLSRRDNDVRDTHEKADGQKRPVDKPFEVGGALLRYPGDPLAPPRETANCFPAETVVAPEGPLEAAWRIPYAGPMVTVRFASGGILTGTPNHPMLTHRGWVALGALAVGHHLLRRLSTEAPPATSGAGTTPQVQAAPARIGEVFDALAQGGDPHRVSGASVNFYGDRADGEVEVVWADGNLAKDREAAFQEPNGEVVLAEPDVRLDARLVDGPAPQLSGAGALSASRSLSGGGQALALDGSSVRQADPLSLSSATGDHSGVEKSTADGASGDPVDAREVILRLSGEVAADEVVDVEVNPEWSGHVYTLSTGTGTYSAGGGYIAANCRCKLLHRSKTTGRFLKTPSRRAG